jgi:predicted transport protein
MNVLLVSIEVFQMGDIKLFRLGHGAKELQGSATAIEKSLQALIENHMEVFFGITFLASEYSTGKNHGGRIDSLGLDENYCPVILEYKRSVSENVINQGLFYLDWLMDHRAEFKLLVAGKLGWEAAENIDWSGTRLICIAGDFTKYDEYAVKQINRNIELIRYRKYGNELILFELMNAVVALVPPASDKGDGARRYQDKTVTEALQQADGEILNIYSDLRQFILGLGDDVQEKILKLYIAFKKIRNFACVEILNKAILLYLNLDPGEVELEEGFSRDVRNVGHWGTGNLEVRISSMEDSEKAKPLIAKSYELT